MVGMSYICSCLRTEGKLNAMQVAGWVQVQVGCSAIQAWCGFNTDAVQGGSGAWVHGGHSAEVQMCQVHQNGQECRASVLCMSIAVRQGWFEIEGGGAPHCTCSETYDSSVPSSCITGT